MNEPREITAPFYLIMAAASCMLVASARHVWVLLHENTDLAQHDFWSKIVILAGIVLLLITLTVFPNKEEREQHP